ncbi:hypothetical protein ACFL20_01640 [Spirochaetota bacterium]
MSYSLTSIISKEYVLIKIEGTWPTQKNDVNDLITQIYDIWEKEKKKYALIDIENIHDTPSIVSDYYTAKLFVDAGFRNINKIAVLDKIQRQKANRFFETTSTNQGMQLHFFYSGKEEAINWFAQENI